MSLIQLSVIRQHEIQISGGYIGMRKNDQGIKGFPGVQGIQMPSHVIRCISPFELSLEQAKRDNQSLDPIHIEKCYILDTHSHSAS